MTRASATAAAKTATANAATANAAATKPQKALKKAPKDVLTVVPCKKTVLAAKMAEVARCERNVVAARMELKARELALQMSKIEHDMAVHTHGGYDVIAPAASVVSTARVGLAVAMSSDVSNDPSIRRPGELWSDVIKRLSNK
jgi:hypothetical protein